MTMQSLGTIHPPHDQPPPDRSTKVNITAPLTLRVDLLDPDHREAFRALTDAERYAYMDGYQTARKRAHDDHKAPRDVSGLIELMGLGREKRKRRNTIV